MLSEAYVMGRNIDHREQCFLERFTMNKGAGAQPAIIGMFEASRI